MTPDQVLIVSALGALFVVIILIAVVGIAIALYMAISRLRYVLTEWRRARRQRLEDLQTCWALETLDTVNHPKE
ncbi:hypothetical protein [Streptomyces bungoensis]|uniref:hypothetical protein n=1 Tax=Streptomyces bungoensis TaxID=285568 RepID=UPI00342CFDA0